MKNVFKSNARSLIYLIDIIIISVAAYLIYPMLYKMINGTFLADYTAHIASAKEDTGYTLMYVIFRICFRFKDSTRAIAIAMIIIIILTVIGVSCLIRYVIKAATGEVVGYGITTLVAATMIFFSSIYIPYFVPHYYNLNITEITQPWHNSTYLLMRMLAIPTFLFFLLIEKKYIERFNYKAAIAFTILLTLTNYAKPSFFIGFAPIMLVLLIYDFIKTRTKSFIPAVKFGICVLLSMSILIYQFKVLFTDDEGQGTALTLGKAYALLSDKYIILSELCNFAFPLLVLILCLALNDKSKDMPLRPLCVSWLMYILSRGESIFITETGSRANDGNYGWGLTYFSFQLYIVSAGYLIAYRHRLGKKVILAWAIWGLNVISGLAYFYKLYHGAYYLI